MKNNNSFMRDSFKSEKKKKKKLWTNKGKNLPFYQQICNDIESFIHPKPPKYPKITKPSDYKLRVSPEDNPDYFLN